MRDHRSNVPHMKCVNITNHKGIDGNQLLEKQVTDTRMNQYFNLKYEKYVENCN